MDVKELDNLFREMHGRWGGLLEILEKIQEEEGYLPREYLEKISRLSNVPLSRLYSISTFYSFFELSPVGRHVISVCMGTACHVMGAQAILQTLIDRLAIRPGETTPGGTFTLTTHDRNFSVRGVRCYGCCSMAPVIVVDGIVHGNVTPEKVIRILEEHRQHSDGG